MRKTKIKTLVCVIIGFRALSCCDAQQDALSHVTNSPCSGILCLIIFTEGFYCGNLG